MSTLSKEAIAESEIILNKTNIALARSRKLIQSWMQDPSPDTQEDDEDDFKPESETAGIGSTATQDDASAINSLARSRKATNDKLLEQLLGKKAAQAHKKSREVAKPQPAQPQPAKTEPVEDDDEEESRTTATLKKQKVNDVAKPSKRKANSYLDELLSKKAKKKAKAG